MGYCGKVRALVASLLLAGGTVLAPTGTSAADGELDTTFGINGFVETMVPNTGEASVTDAIVLNDGRILVLATTKLSFFSNSEIALAAYHPDGELDTTFGTGGFFQPDLSFDQLWTRTLSETQDGMILFSALGREKLSDPDRTGVVFQITGQGDIDTGFGSNGRQFTAPGNVTAYPDGGFLVTGSFEPDSTNRADEDIAVWKHGPGGALESAFGSNGRAVIRFGNYRDIPFDAVVQSDGRVVIVGLAGRDRGFTGGVLTGDLGIARLTEDGLADESFGLNGKVITPTLFESNGVRVALTENNLVVAGESRTDSSSGPSVLTPTVAFYLSDGSPDVNFGDQDIVYLDTGAGLQGRMVTDFWFQPDGKFLLALDELGDNGRGPGMVRLLGNGTTDPEFGDTGYVLLGPQFLFFASGHIIVTDGRTISAGSFRNSFSESTRIGLVALTGGVAELVFTSNFE